MNNNDKDFLSIILYDNEKNEEYLFRAISSISNQIGFNIKKNIKVIVISNKIMLSKRKYNNFFDNLNIEFHLKVGNINGNSLNKVLKNNSSEWITFMNSKDLLYSDGSLLDFISLSNNSYNNDILVFKYLISVLNDNKKIIDFENQNFINVIFGKYFKVSFLRKENIYFNEKLNKYIFDDFSSKAIEISSNILWFNDLVNYYMSPRENIKESFTEFVKYRTNFINFINDNIQDKNRVFNDIVWSIVRAFYIMNCNDEFNCEEKKEFIIFANIITKYPNYMKYLTEEFYRQNNEGKMDYSKFEKLLGEIKNV